MTLPRYIVLEKLVGETPLQRVEAYRAKHPELTDVPLAYAGRLDPMASGTLLVLVGDECKRQAEYHGLDKTYEFSVLLGIRSDTGDVLGRLTTDSSVPEVSEATLRTIAESLTGPISLPYPAYSSKTVAGKQLHQWALEGKIDNIAIPTKDSMIYSLSYRQTETLSRQSLCQQARTKIDTLPTVTEASKALGRDFRRDDIRADWEQVAVADTLPQVYQIAQFVCTCSSGTYMRTLAEIIAAQAGARGLAWSIHRTTIGRWQDGNWVEAYSRD